MKKTLLLTLIIIIICITGFGIFIHGKDAGSINIIHEQTEMQHIISFEGMGLEYPFFGLAFHLEYDPEQYEFDHYELGGFFGESDDPMVFVEDSQEHPEVIAGISLKRGKTINKSEGTFLKLYFNKKVYEPNFTSFKLEDGIYSSFDKGRKDIKSVEFGYTCANC